MIGDHDTELLAARLEQMIQLLGSIRVLLSTGVPRDALPALRDDVQSLTTAVQILSGTLKRRSQAAASALV